MKKTDLCKTMTRMEIMLGVLIVMEIGVLILI